MISSRTLILSSGKGRLLLIQVNQNPSISLRPLLARNGHPGVASRCPLSGDELTELRCDPTSVYDPKPSFLFGFEDSTVRDRGCCSRAVTVLKLQRDEARQQCCWIELADDRFDIGETACNWMQWNDVAIADRGQSDETEVD